MRQVTENELERRYRCEQRVVDVETGGVRKGERGWFRELGVSFLVGY